jgi:hypothetical protein
MINWWSPLSNKKWIINFIGHWLDQILNAYWNETLKKEPCLTNLKCSIFTKYDYIQFSLTIMVSVNSSGRTVSEGRSTNKIYTYRMHLVGKKYNIMTNKKNNITKVSRVMYEELSSDQVCHLYTIFLHTSAIQDIRFFPFLKPYNSQGNFKYAGSRVFKVVSMQSSILWMIAIQWHNLTNTSAISQNSILGYSWRRNSVYSNMFMGVKLRFSLPFCISC